MNNFLNTFFSGAYFSMMINVEGKSFCERVQMFWGIKI